MKIGIIVTAGIAAMLLSVGTGLADPLPKWIDNPQRAADDDELAFVGEATDSSSDDKAKKAAHKAAERRAVEAVLELIDSADDALRGALAEADLKLDAQAARKAAEKIAAKKFKGLPIERWHATVEQVEGEDPKIRAWVFVQFAKMELARVAIEAAAPLVKPAKGGAKPDKAVVRAALKSGLNAVGATLPPN